MAKFKGLGRASAVRPGAWTEGPWAPLARGLAAEAGPDRQRGNGGAARVQRAALEGEQARLGTGAMAHSGGATWISVPPATDKQYLSA